MTDKTKSAFEKLKRAVERRARIDTFLDKMSTDGGFRARVAEVTGLPADLIDEMAKTMREVTERSEIVLVAAASDFVETWFDNDAIKPGTDTKGGK